MTRDEQMYPEAELFNPERFMTQNGKEADQTDPRDFVFGFGRRQVFVVVLIGPFFPHSTITHPFLENVQERSLRTQTCGWFRRA
jgi:hypothetical protein